MTSFNEDEFDLETVKFAQVRSYCRHKGIEYKRSDTKAILIEKINAHCAEDISTTTHSAPDIVATETKIIQPENLDKELKSLGIEKEVFIPKIKKTSDGFTSDEVVTECNNKFGGKAHAIYNRDNPEMIEFHGGARQRQDVSINQPKRSILIYAGTYMSKAYTHDIGKAA